MSKCVSFAMDLPLSEKLALLSERNDEEYRKLSRKFNKLRQAEMIAEERACCIPDKEAFYLRAADRIHERYTMLIVKKIEDLYERAVYCPE